MGRELPDLWGGGKRGEDTYGRKMTGGVLIRWLAWFRKE